MAAQGPVHVAAPAHAQVLPRAGIQKTVESYLDVNDIGQLKNANSGTNKSLRRDDRQRYYNAHHRLRTDFTDADLHALAEKCPELQSLSLDDRRGITVAGLQTLVQNFPNLRNLDLSNIGVNSEMLQVLSGLTQLESLHLSGHGTIDASVLQELTGLRALRSLSLDNKHIREAGWQVLSGLTQLESLNLYDTTACAYIRNLETLRNLKVLYLGNNGIRNQHLPVLARLTSLQILDLGGNEISDAGLLSLETLTHLQKLYLDDCPNVTNDGINDLRQRFRENHNRELVVIR